MVAIAKHRCREMALSNTPENPNESEAPQTSTEEQVDLADAELEEVSGGTITGPGVCYG